MKKNRLVTVFLIITIMTCLLLLVHIGSIIVSGGPSASSYRNPEVADQVIRGSIYDRKGRLLAVEVPYWSCAFLHSYIPDMKVAAEVVAPYLSLTVDEILAMAGRNTTYTLLARKVPDAVLDGLRSAISKAGLGHGILLEKKYGREYPATFHAAQVTGFTDTENRGLEGMELFQDDFLSPYPELSEDITHGGDVYLTLDMDIQYLLDVNIQNIADEHMPDYVFGIIMDSRTGEILASASYPWYDANRYNLSTESERNNRVISYMYEPGSVFKVFSLAAVMDIGQADIETPFDETGTYTFTMSNGETATIRSTSSRGLIGPAEFIKYSTNGAIAHWSLQTDSTQFRQKLLDFGFGQSWDTGQRGVIPGLLAPVSSWSGRSKPTIAFGQEIGVSALQMATAATVFANDGVLLAPHIIMKKTAADGMTVYQADREEVRTVLSPGISEKILSYMVGATEPGGTAIHAAVDGIKVAAKTGTAQIINPETNTYTDGSVLASTLALVPAENPKYILYIAAANPTGRTIWGSNIAAPALSNIISGLISQGKLFTDSARVIPVSQ